MPVVNIMMLEGRTKEQKCQLVFRLTTEICNVCKCKPEAVTIIIEDIPKTNWGTGGTTKD